jgi:hypothetical protein
MAFDTTTDNNSAVLPPGNQGPMPPVAAQTQNAPITGQLQPPAAPAPVSVQPPAAASSQPPVTTTSPNTHLHGFIGRILGALAGDAPTQYATDANGKTTAVPAAPMTTGDKVKRIAEHALVGLAASGNAAPSASGLGKALSGFGAGANAVMQKEQQQDKDARQKSREDFDQEQQTKLRRYEILRQNALTAATHYGNIKAQNEMTPVFAQNESLFNAVKNSPELGAHAVEMTSEQVKQAAQSYDPADPEHFAHTHIIKPMGWEPVTDGEGNPVMTTDADGNPVPKEQMRMAVIDATKDGKIAVTPGMAADFKKYGEKARIPNAGDIKAGDEYELGQLIPLMNAVDEQKKQELGGWANPGSAEDKDGNVLEINTWDPTQTRPARADRAEAYKTNKLKLQADLAEKQSQTAKNYAEAGKAKSDTAGTGGSSGLVGEDYIKTLPAGDAATVRAIGEGRQQIPSRATKEGLRLANMVNQAYPDWDQTKGTTWNKARNEYMGSGQTAKAVTAANTALEHMQRMFDHSTGKGVYDPLSNDYQALSTDVTFVTGELGKAVKGGVISEGEAKDIRASISGGLTPALKRQRIKEATQILHDRIQETQDKFQAAAPSEQIKAPVLMSAAAGKAYDYINGNQQPQQTQSGQPQNAPPANLLKEGTHTTFANGQTWTLQNGVPVQVQAPGQGQ